MSKEYINRELLENALEDENKNGNFVFTANWIMEIVDNLPNADVVPKSEVAREIVTDIADLMWQGEDEKLNISLGGSYYSKQEFIAELKKKYTA